MQTSDPKDLGRENAIALITAWMSAEDPEEREQTFFPLLREVIEAPPVSGLTHIAMVNVIYALLALITDDASTDVQLALLRRLARGVLDAPIE